VGWTLNGVKQSTI